MWRVVSCLIGGMSLNIIFNVNKTLDLATKRCYITCILWLLSHDPLISCKGLRVLALVVIDIFEESDYGLDLDLLSISY